jgi:Fur family iron response transcriptional regulator
MDQRVALDTGRRIETHQHHLRPLAAVLSRLRAVGLRPTKQRLALAKILFDRPTTRHITAEQLFAEATTAGVQVSLATIYNTLHQFTDAGLLRECVLEPGRTHFDSNTTRHHHIIIEDTREVLDVDPTQVEFARLPKVPQGTEIEQIEVVIRVRTRGSGGALNDNE